MPNRLISPFYHQQTRKSTEIYPTGSRPSYQKQNLPTQQKTGFSKKQSRQFLFKKETAKNPKPPGVLHSLPLVRR
jgi:hypothetical protein